MTWKSTLLIEKVSWFLWDILRFVVGIWTEGFIATLRLVLNFRNRRANYRIESGGTLLYSRISEHSGIDGYLDIGNRCGKACGLISFDCEVSSVTRFYFHEEKLDLDRSLTSRWLVIWLSRWLKDFRTNLRRIAVEFWSIKRWCKLMEFVKKTILASFSSVSNN